MVTIVKEQAKELARKLNILPEYMAAVTPQPDEIPTLVPDSVMAIWKDEKEPYFKCQAINYPILANGYNYKESFFQEFISKLSDRPFPGAKTGHDMNWGARPNTDFLLVGGKLVKNGDGSGIVMLKNYIPPQGAETSNERFIQECKSDMVHFSLVSVTKDEIIRDDIGTTINVIGSIRGERNDAVEFGMGAMDQKTNDQKSDIELIPETTAVGGKKNIWGGYIMDPEKKKLLMDTLRGLKSNGEITLHEIAAELGLKHQVLTEEHTEAVKFINAIKALGVKDPVAEIKTMQKTIADGEVAVRNAMITKEFGPEKFANGKENDLRTFIVSQIKDETGDALTARMNELKGSSLAKKLAAEQADYRSDVNIASVEHTATETTPTEGGVRVDKM
jgi:hypothetical protein